jgi:hypothetical protein
MSKLNDRCQAEGETLDDRFGAVGHTLDDRCQALGPTYKATGIEDTPDGPVLHGEITVPIAEPVYEAEFRWRVVVPDVTPEMRQARALLMGLTEEQRGLVLCWFCSSCRRYVGPGDSCNCERDE